MKRDTFINVLLIIAGILLAIALFGAGVLWRSGATKDSKSHAPALFVLRTEKWIDYQTSWRPANLPACSSGSPSALDCPALSSESFRSSTLPHRLQQMQSGFS
jgi:hypothetical protein